MSDTTDGSVVRWAGRSQERLGQEGAPTKPSLEEAAAERKGPESRGTVQRRSWRFVAALTLRAESEGGEDGGRKCDRSKREVHGTQQ